MRLDIADSPAHRPCEVSQVVRHSILFDDYILKKRARQVRRLYKVMAQCIRGQCFGINDLFYIFTYP